MLRVSANARTAMDTGPNNGEPRGWAKKSLLVATGMLLAGVLATVVGFSYLPTNDGPQHVFVAHVGNRIAAGDAFCAELYAAGSALSPLGFDFLFATLETFLSWRWALRLALSIIVLTWASGAFALSGVVHPTRRVAGLIGIALALQWSLYMGFFSFVLACGLAWWGIFALLRADLSRWPHRLGLAVLCLSAAVAHTFGGLLLVATFLLHAVVMPEGLRAKLRSAAGMTLMTLPALGVWIHSIGSLATLEQLSQYRAATNHWLSATDCLALASCGFVTGGVWRKVVVAVLVLIGIGVAAHSVARRSATKHELILLIMSACACVAYFLTPLHLRSWELVSPRFLPIVVVAALPLVPVERLRSRPLTLGAIGLATLLSGGMLVESWFFHARLDRGCSAALAGLGRNIQASGMRLPVFGDTSCGLPKRWQDSPVPFVQPLMNAGALYAVDQGGVVPNTFTVIPEIHVLVKTSAYWQKMPVAPNRQSYLPPLVMLPPGNVVRTEVIGQLVAAGRAFDDVIVYAAPDLLAALEQAGYETVWVEGGVTSLRFPRDGEPRSWFIRP